MSRSQHIKNIAMKALAIAFLQCEAPVVLWRFYRLPKEALSAREAIIISYSILLIFLDISSELMAQNAVFIAKHHGDLSSPQAQNTDPLAQAKVGSLLRQGWLLALMLSCPSIIILLKTRHSLIGLFEPTVDAKEIANTQLFWLAFMIPLALINTVSQRFLSATHQEIWLYPYRFFTTGVEIGCGALWIPRYLTSGVAYATLVKECSGTLLLTCLLCSSLSSLKQLKIKQWNVGDPQYLWRTLRQGLANTSGQCITTLSNFAITTLVGRLGPIALMIDQMAYQYHLWLSTLHIGISESANRWIAFYHGAQNTMESYSIGNTALALDSLSQLMGILLLNIFLKPLTTPFLDPLEQAQHTAQIRAYFTLVSVISLLNIILDCTRQMLAGIEDTTFVALCQGLSTIFLVLPGVSAVFYFTDWGLPGIGTAIALGTLPATLVSLQHWQHRTIPETAMQSTRYCPCSYRFGLFSKTNKAPNHNESEALLDHQSDYTASYLS